MGENCDNITIGDIMCPTTTIRMSNNQASITIGTQDIAIVLDVLRTIAFCLVNDQTVWVPIKLLKNVSIR